MSDIISSLLPSPLHPAVVHLPMALAVLLPIFAGAAAAAVYRGAPAIRVWAVAVAMFAALSLSAWVSVETGEDESEKVERVVPESALEAHEEEAELFLRLSVAALAIAAAGFLKGRPGGIARGVATAAAVALTVQGYRVGHAGGELVYKHGAASAYTSPAASGGVSRERTDQQDER